MRFGLILSIALHAAIILIATLTIVKITPIAMPTDDIPVDVVTIDQKTNVTAEAPKEAKPVEQPPAPAPTPAPPAPEPPSNEAVLTPQEKPEPKKPEPPKPQEKPKQEDKPKEEHLDLTSLQAKLKDLSKTQHQKEQKTAEAPAPGTGEPRPKVGEGDNNTADIQTFLINSMKRQVGACWNFPAGAVQAEELILFIDIQLRPDGNLAGPPVIEEENRMGEPYFRAAAEASVRAINRCQPYELPADYYDVWKDMRLTFDPRKMLGQ